MKPSVRIEKSPSIYTIKFENGEGPFKDLPSLKKKSTIYRNLVLRNIPRAQQICLEKNIEVIKDFVFTKEDFSTTKNFLEIIQHCVKGKVKKGKITGVHYYDTKKVKIINILKKNTSNGIWKTEIEFYDSNTKRWIKKIIQQPFSQIIGACINYFMNVSWQ